MPTNRWNHVASIYDTILLFSASRRRLVNPKIDASRREGGYGMRADAAVRRQKAEAELRAPVRAAAAAAGAAAISYSCICYSVKASFKDC